MSLRISEDSEDEGPHLTIKIKGQFKLTLMNEIKVYYF